MADDLEKLGDEMRFVESKAESLGNLENIGMYTRGIFEMANYSTEDSGLPYGIWFDEAGCARNNKHTSPRVKVIMKSGNFIPISVEEHPKILLKGTRLKKAEMEFNGKEKLSIFSFVSRNRKLILQHWNGEVTTKTLFINLE